MAYREVREMDIEQVIRRWMAGASSRVIARATGVARNTVKRVTGLAQELGMIPGGEVCEEQIRVVRERMGKPGAPVQATKADEALEPHRDRIERWLESDRLVLTKVHELLLREGVTVSYPTLYRYARRSFDFGSSASTVRRQDSLAGEVAEVDFGRLGLFQELGSAKPRMLWAFIMTMNHSRLACVVPTFSQDILSVIECFERAFEFFGGCPRRVVVDNFKAVVETADRYTPRYTKTFLEYAKYRGFLPDAARAYHPKDKPVVENTVRFVRERFWKGETFLDIDEVWRRAQHWCREVAGRRVHGTTQRIPLEVFQTEELPALIPLAAGRFDTPQWGQSKVHPDCHIRFGKAFYSVPDRWRGCRMDVRADRSLVRIYNRGELIKTHPCVEAGKKSTDLTDYPDHKAPYAMRWPDFYRKKARELGEQVGVFTDSLLGGEFPWSRLRQAQKLLRLAERYGAERLDRACARALRFESVDVRSVERILQQALEADATPEAVVGTPQELPLKFLRPSDHFAHPQTGEGGSSC